MRKLLSEIIVTASAILIIGCSDDDRMSEKAMIPELDSIDYEIISSALEWFLISYKKGSGPNYSNEDRKYSGNPFAEALIIDDSTSFDGPPKRRSFVTREYDSVENFIADRIRIENKRKYRILDKRISTFKTYSLAEGNNLKSTFEKLYSKYPDAWGIVGFSKPVYSLYMERAAIYVYFRKAGKWGQGVYVSLKKENKVWVVYDITRLWIS